ncbi:tRNA (adenosine(37)-N6)-threonylcarbamoyltransferase complex ATPase subunit type 1 TsaE [Propionimicrobium lymphophilum]|uniref:tRNA (adenosine(37)-N6)-threonylcarbamoyltransferase complex ATPase subunit type 1 TsaE n=1 Tax=Propionimicrobium lymphophilum TaxID=33012 RepID=UPI0023F32B7F|nr:tRNA (adenosine(37)-N6)-threonylcarbamoyltransferase complex ATPase subunit type 1 TsaE [Propionimicrobium lymphophilum]
MSQEIEILAARPEDAQRIADVIGHPDLSEPSSLSVDEIRKLLETEIGVLALADGEPVGALFLDVTKSLLHDVHVIPQVQDEGIGAEMIRAVAELAADQGATELHVNCPTSKTARGWYLDNGFVSTGSSELTRKLPLRVIVPDAGAMKKLGAKLAKILVPGDMIIASGELGAGKTTFTQGLGAGMGVSGPVISPTFVLSRIHENENGPALIHVDAYRLGSAAELEDLDLELQMENAVTLVEWGDGLAEGLRENRLNLEILRASNPADQTRIVYLDGVGPRWQDVDLAAELQISEGETK